MKQDYIIFTKVYAIHHKEGAFKLYVSLHNDNYYYAGLLYYVRTGSWLPGESLSIDMESKHFRDIDENAVRQKALNWLKNNIEGEFTIEAKETIS
jgi:hypothetical protein